MVSIYMVYMKKQTKVTRQDVQFNVTGAGVREGIKKGGALLAPFGYECIGYACVFYYQDKREFVNEARFITQQLTSLTEVPEMFADFGHKELQGTMMAAYGKKPPEKRKA